MTVTTKTERLEMRLSREQRALLERAAALEGQAMASFVRSKLVESAQQVIDRHARTTLSARDFERFLHVLDRQEPSAALKAAFRRRKRRG